MHSLASTRPRRTVSGPAMAGSISLASIRITMTASSCPVSSIIAPMWLCPSGRTGSCAASRPLSGRPACRWMPCRPGTGWPMWPGRLPSRLSWVFPRPGLICWLIPVFPMVPGYPHRRHLAWRWCARYAQRTTSRCRCRRWWHGWRSRSNMTS